MVAKEEFVQPSQLQITGLAKRRLALHSGPEFPAPQSLRSPFHSKKITMPSPLVLFIITEYTRAACGLKYKMDYRRIKETNLTMRNQLYFALNYVKNEV